MCSQYPAAYQLACELTSNPDINTANDLVDLLETEIQPLVRCEWGKDLFVRLSTLHARRAEIMIVHRR